MVTASCMANSQHWQLAAVSSLDMELRAISERQDRPADQHANLSKKSAAQSFQLFPEFLNIT